MLGTGYLLGVTVVCPTRNCFLDFAVKHWFDCRTTESGFTGDIGAIEVWLIDMMGTFFGFDSIGRQEFPHPPSRSSERQPTL